MTTRCLFVIPGRTYVLLFRSVTPEDMGEIKFTADKASSTAKLKVKGKQVCFVCVNTVYTVDCLLYCMDQLTIMLQCSFVVANGFFLIIMSKDVTKLPLCIF